MTTAGLVGVLLLAAISFNFLSPELGGKPTKEERQLFAQTGHYQAGKFQNLQPTRTLTVPSERGFYWKMLTRSQMGPCPCKSWIR
jgi:hypothetical protein